MTARSGSAARRSDRDYAGRPGDEGSSPAYSCPTSGLGGGGGCWRTTRLSVRRSCSRTGAGRFCQSSVRASRPRRSIGRGGGRVARGLAWDGSVWLGRATAVDPSGQPHQRRDPDYGGSGRGSTAPDVRGLVFRAFSGATEVRHQEGRSSRGGVRGGIERRVGIPDRSAQRLSRPAGEAEARREGTVFTSPAARFLPELA